MSTLAKALSMVERGFLVFPCGANKTPVCKRGFLAATCDPAKVRWLFRNSAAELIGVPTGAVSGFDVLDWDPKNGGSASIASIRHRLPETREHRTRSGGGHLVFLHHEGICSTIGKLAPGLDTRGDGGYIIWWPEHGCLISNIAPPVAWPTWLATELLSKPAPTAANTAWRERVAGDDTYARRLIQRQLQKVASARDGQRHVTLRAASKVIGGILDLDDELTMAEAEAHLLSAVKEAGGDDVVDTNAKATIAWGLAWGKANPLTVRGSNG